MPSTSDIQDFSGFATMASLLGDAHSRQASINTSPQMMDYIFTLLATRVYVDQKITDLIGSAPATLDTLKEISDRLSTDSDALTSLNSALAALSSALTGYLPTLGSLTLSQLPAASGNAGKKAWITDLHDGLGGYVTSNGSIWIPDSPLRGNKVVTNANQALTLTPLVNAPNQILRGTLTAARALTLSVTGVYPGCRYWIKREAGGLFNVSIAGIVTAAGTVTINIPGVSPSWVVLEYSAELSAFVQMASGGLL